MRTHAHHSLNRFWTLTILLLLGLVWTTAAIAQRDVRRYNSPHWELDTRHGHNHYYPAREYVVATLPPEPVHVVFGGNHFYFKAGVWFRPHGPNFIVVTPPIGVAIPVLPPSYTTLWIGGVPYYYANGVYYAQTPGVPGYAVVAPPPGNETAPIQPAVSPPVSTAPPSPSSGSDAFFVYPRNGQTEAQIAQDRSECNRWATGQLASDNPGDSQRQQRFQRALGACLEGRGYTVK
jgi:hypothetical protein